MTAADTAPVLAQLEKGQEVARRDLQLSRADLVRYAAASGDFNPIHWNQEFAVSVGLPDVIAHGMLTMGAAMQLVADWAGIRGASSTSRPASPSRSWCRTASARAPPRFSRPPR